MRNPLNINLNINNEQEDCKIGIVCRGEGMKEIKVRVFV
jgi:hypothetical protein